MKRQIHLIRVGIFSLGALIISAGSFTSCATAVNEPRLLPNILLIMVDDMGYSDLGYFGSRIETPHIDLLAREGMVFTQFYNTSRCCPSRAALLTGLYQHQAGVGDMTGDRGHPSYQGFLNDRCLTLAEVLKEAGYTTLMSGKWHLGSAREQWPTRRGFDRFFGIPEGGGVYFTPFMKPRNVVLNDSVLEPGPGFYSTSAFNEYAIMFMEEAIRRKQPFFLYLAHIAPHFPLQAPRERTEKYRGRFRDGFQDLRREKLDTMIRKGLLPAHTVLGASDERVRSWEELTEAEKDRYDLEMSVYAAQLEMVDDGVGRMLRLLEERGELDHTMILFLSDNGGCHEAASVKRRFSQWDGELGGPDSYRAYSPSWAHVSNTPFRMYKHWVHEGGISSPLIVHYPPLIREPMVNPSVVHIMDLMPTLLELAGHPFPDREEVLPPEGKSFLPLLEGAADWDRDPLFWEHEGNRAARKGNWKIVSAWPENRWRLYNMEKDRMEHEDLSRKYPEIKEELIRLYDSWSVRAGVVPWGELTGQKE